LATSFCAPITRPVRVAEPTILQEPVTLAQVKHQLGIGLDDTGRDPELQDIIVQARAWAEKDTNVVCYTGSYTWKLSEFPCRDWLELPDIRPITSVTSIVYVASDGTSTTWSTSEYTFEATGIHQFVRLNYGYSWPVVRGGINGITVTFVAGFATVAAVDPLMKRCVLNKVSQIWEDREGLERTARDSASERLCDLLRTRSYS
jgi:uncharacterized phiE125 gp8 family phage protein